MKEINIKLSEKEIWILLHILNIASILMKGSDKDKQYIQTTNLYNKISKEYNDR